MPSCEDVENAPQADDRQDLHQRSEGIQPQAGNGKARGREIAETEQDGAQTGKTDRSAKQQAGAYGQITA